MENGRIKPVIQSRQAKCKDGVGANQKKIKKTAEEKAKSHFFRFALFHPSHHPCSCCSCIVSPAQHSILCCLLTCLFSLTRSTHHLIRNNTCVAYTYLSAPLALSTDELRFILFSLAAGYIFLLKASLFSSQQPMRALVCCLLRLSIRSRGDSGDGSGG